MRGGTSREVVRHLRTLYELGVAGPFTDEQLLGRFLASRDGAAEEAFAELVQRHGPMVLGVCRRILGDAHEAEDAFQATFLVLARKAATVVRREKVASWLYGVAVRTAREARLRSARRRAREERVSKPIQSDPPDGGFPAELREILDEELARLPARHRGPVVLCELEGLPHPEAARRLGIPKGTLSSRLARAKARLRDRLSARGVTLPAAALSAILVREARAATVPFSLFESTVQAATLVASGPSIAAAGVLSASAASLSEGVIQTMFVAKLKGIALAVGTMTAVVSGAAVLAQPGPQGPSNVYRAEPDDRVTALEKKLDRVLEALERLSHPAPVPTANVATSDSTVASDLPAPSSVTRTSAAAPGGPVRENPPQPRDTSPPPSTNVALTGAPVAPTEHPPVAPTELQPVMADNLPTPPPAPQPVTVSATPNQGPSPTRRTSSFEPQPVTVSATPNQPMPLDPTPPPMPRAPLVSRLDAMENQMRLVQQRLERLEKRFNALDARVGGGDGGPSVTEDPPLHGPGGR